MQDAKADRVAYLSRKARLAFLALMHLVKQVPLDVISGSTGRSFKVFIQSATIRSVSKADIGAEHISFIELR
jgi:hypothetical protein